MTSVGSNDIRQIFSLLGQGVHDSIDVYIAGSIPTMIQGLTARPTDDIGARPPGDSESVHNRTSREPTSDLRTTDRLRSGS